MVNIHFFQPIFLLDFVPESNLWNPIQFIVHFNGNPKIFKLDLVFSQKIKNRHQKI